MTKIPLILDGFSSPLQLSLPSPHPPSLSLSLPAGSGKNQYSPISSSMYFSFSWYRSKAWDGLLFQNSLSRFAQVIYFKYLIFSITLFSSPILIHRHLYCCIILHEFSSNPLPFSLLWSYSDFKEQQQWRDASKHHGWAVPTRSNPSHSQFEDFNFHGIEDDNHKFSTWYNSWM